MDPSTLATAALFTPTHPAAPALYFGGAFALATVVVCGWAVESTRHNQRKTVRTQPGPMFRTPSQVELMDYTRIPDAEETSSEHEDALW